MHAISRGGGFVCGIAVAIAMRTTLTLETTVMQLVGTCMVAMNVGGIWDVTRLRGRKEDGVRRCKRKRGEEEESVALKMLRLMGQWWRWGGPLLRGWRWLLSDGSRWWTPWEPHESQVCAI